MQRFPTTPTRFISYLKRYADFGLLIPWVALILLVGFGAVPAHAQVSRTPDPVNACSLLVASEVEAIIGGPVGEPKKTHKEQKSSGFWMSMCQYYSEKKEISVGITVKPHGKKVDGAQAFTQHEADLRKALGNNYKMEIVPEIGDRAGWEASTKQLTIFQGPLMVIVGIVSPKLGGKEALDMSSRFAEKVVVKLPRQ